MKPLVAGNSLAFSNTQTAGRGEPTVPVCQACLQADKMIKILNLYLGCQFQSDAVAYGAVRHDDANFVLFSLFTTETEMIESVHGDVYFIY